MPSAQARKIEAIRVGEKGQIAVPPKYCKLHKLSKGSEVLLIQLGETPMVVPSDMTLDRLCDRILEALAGRGISVARALKNLSPKYVGDAFRAFIASGNPSTIPRVFLDSGVLLEGLLAPWSVSRAFLILSRRRVFKIILAEYVRGEVEANLLNSLPQIRG